MKRRRTLEEIAQIYARMDERDPRCIHEILSPASAGLLLFRTSERGCLTHIARYVLDAVASYRTWLNGGYQRSAHAECGVFASSGSNTRAMIVIDTADATFGCHACIARCEELGLPTYNLIPDTGCSATGGERYRRGPRLTELAPP